MRQPEPERDYKIPSSEGNGVRYSHMSLCVRACGCGPQPNRPRGHSNLAQLVFFSTLLVSSSSDRTNRGGASPLPSSSVPPPLDPIRQTSRRSLSSSPLSSAPTRFVPPIPCFTCPNLIATPDNSMKVFASPNAADNPDSMYFPFLERLTPPNGEKR